MYPHSAFCSINCCSPICFQKLCFPGPSSLPSQSVCPSYLLSLTRPFIYTPTPLTSTRPLCSVALRCSATWLHRRCCCERQDYFPFLSSPPLSNIINSPFLSSKESNASSFPKSISILRAILPLLIITGPLTL